MTRQKKEIIKKIIEITEWISVDEEMGCGFAPEEAYDTLYNEIHKLEEQLASLSHYDSVEAMYTNAYRNSNDLAEELPFL